MLHAGDVSNQAGDVSNQAEDELGLAAGLAGLARLVSGSGTLELMLTQVANLAVQAVPGADGAGVTMLESGQPDTIVASAPFVREVDRVQYRLGEGPCISAASTGVTTGSGGLGEDLSWPMFGPLAAELGIHSAISLPLVLDHKVVGALNVYARDRNAFDAASRHLGEQFAAPAAVAIHNARTLDQAQRTAAQLEVALTGRSTIDRAVGIVIERSGISAEDAFIRLRIMSQHEGETMTTVAERMIRKAMRPGRVDESASPPERTG